MPGEVPPQLTAYKTQQARWAKGSTQCLRKHAGAVLRSDLTPLQKWMGLLHLGQYAIQPVVLLLFLLTPPVLLTGVLARLPLGPLGIAGLAPPLIIALGQIALYPDWPRRLAHFPALMLLSTAMMLSNSRAVLEGLTGTGSRAFVRTPKFRVVHRHDRPASQAYAIRPDWTTAGELALGGYAVLGLAIAADRFPAMVPYMIVYVVAFGFLGVASLWQARDLPRRASQNQPRRCLVGAVNLVLRKAYACSASLTGMYACSSRYARTFATLSSTVSSCVLSWMSGFSGSS